MTRGMLVWGMIVACGLGAADSATAAGPTRKTTTRVAAKPATPQPPAEKKPVLVPGSGVAIKYGTDDFENEKWAMNYRHPKSSEEQTRFYDTVWDNRRWRAMARILFGKPAIYLISPERDFFEYHDGAGVPEYLLENSRRHLSSVAAQENHMLHYLLFGQFGPHLPHFVREENYGRIRARLETVVMHEGPVETAFPAFGRFDAFNLSNIFEYTSPGTFEVLAESMAAGANPGARFAYWNVLVRRALSTARPDAFRNRLDTGRDRSIPDKGWHYSRFLLDERTCP